MMHEIYMPFTEKRLKEHFARVKIQGVCVETAENHLKYYRKSVENYTKRTIESKSISKIKEPYQIEKDEKFWTAACLMTIFHSQNRIQELSKLYRKAYGPFPPITGVHSWEECFGGNLHLFFETNLPSPLFYRQKWLRDKLKERQIIPYILNSDNGTKNLEGPTNVDALLVNKDNGFAVIIEAKVLSDISYQITYDTMRNQIARNIDVMLERNESLCKPLNKRDPDKTLFMLLTPKPFKDNPKSRLYGYKFNDYKENPATLQDDLPHRENLDAESISKRLGWLTWEDFQEVNSECCKWLALRDKTEEVING
ncbi:MAG: hypothetical protein JSV09_12100 [Thermoplasmata archaeon]|nr:MAG: hypothetical protein JSV09_12100 [Thermoplasmata archaeon]